jgi:hypothetical protein
MKRIFLFISLLQTATQWIVLLAQVPYKMNYQAVVRDASGQIIANRLVSLRLTIRVGSPSGSIVYQETHQDTTNEYGLVNVLIGTGSSQGLFSNVDWKTGGSKFLEVELDPNGGTSYVSMGVSQLVTVPYAFSSYHCEDQPWTKSSGGNIYYNNGNVGIGALSTDISLRVESSNSNTPIALFKNKVGTSSAYVYIKNASDYGGYLGYSYSKQGFVLSSILKKDMSFYTNNLTKLFITLEDTTYRIGFFTSNPRSDLDIRKNFVSIGNDNNSFKSINFRHAHGDTACRLYVSPIYFGIDMPAYDTVYPYNVGAGIYRTSRSFIPFSSSISLGNSTYRWKEVWAVNGSIQTSDERFKKNIQEVKYGLETVMKLHPVMYEWKDETMGKSVNIGFLAQEVKKILPEVVVHQTISEREKREPKEWGADAQSDNYGMKYAEIIPVLTKAIQEQQLLIEELRNEIEKLKQK